MALRVLLADESSTIKKVMQLALQDFAVEVKAVPIGLDVMQVCRAFQPDIIFVDILLAKKNGYEVSAEIKSDPVLKKIPIVMMWSGFMELDEAKAKQAKIDQRLEKPFDADTLRDMVKALVPKLSGNLISSFVTFPEMPEFVEPEAPPQSERLKTKLRLEEEPDLEPNLQDLDEPEDFQSVPLPKNQAQLTKSQSRNAPKRDDWSEQDLSRFKLEIPKEDNFNRDPGDLTCTSIALSSGVEEIALEDIDNPNPQPVKRPAPRPAARQHELPQAPRMPSVDPVRAEEIIRNEARHVLETIAWKILPDVVERIVREELQKLLKDAERL